MTKINNLQIFAETIINNCCGIYYIDLVAKTYSCLKSNADLDLLFGKTGDFSDLFQKLYFNNNQNTANESYRRFFELDIPGNEFFTFNTVLNNENGPYDVSCFHFPGKSGSFAFFTISSQLASYYSEKMIRDKIMDEKFLYSMIVSLNKDECLASQCSETIFSDFSNIPLSYTQWREFILPSIHPVFQDLFTDFTDPDNIRARLENENSSFIDLQMQKLSGEWVWTRHMYAKVKIAPGDISMVYNVHDIDLEKKKTLSWMRNIIQMSKQEIPLSISEISKIDNDSAVGSNVHISAQSLNILQKLEKYIRRHYMENLTLNQLADKYYMNSAYLGQLFIQKYKMSFHEYLSIQRMETAAHLLSTTNYSIQEISGMVGLSSIQYFIRMFRKFYGCTPFQYRRSFR